MNATKREGKREAMDEKLNAEVTLASYVFHPSTMVGDKTLTKKRQILRQ